MQKINGMRWKRETENKIRNPQETHLFHSSFFSLYALFASSSSSLNVNKSLSLCPSPAPGFE